MACCTSTTRAHRPLIWDWRGSMHCFSPGLQRKVPMITFMRTPEIVTDSWNSWPNMSRKSFIEHFYIADSDPDLSTDSKPRPKWNWPVTFHAPLTNTVEANDRLLVKTATVRCLSLTSIQFRTAHYQLSSRPLPFLEIVDPYASQRLPATVTHISLFPPFFLLFLVLFNALNLL
jgi:hypothetical protein